MRRFLSLLLLCLSMLSMPAWAADDPKPEAAPAHGARKTWQQHFTDANLAHNGHLTLNEAQGGYADVAKHFEDIDADHKGYVTENDIRAWRVMRKAAHRLMKQPDDKLRPRSAVQRTYPDFRAIPVARRQTLAVSDSLIPTDACVDRYQSLLPRAAAGQPGAQTGRLKRRSV